MTAGEPAPGAARGVAFMLASAVAFAATHTAVRHLTGDLHAFQIAFFRNLFALVLLAPWLFRAGPAALRTARPGLFVARGSLNAAFILIYFLALGLVPVATVTALNFTAPLFTVALAALLLGEPVGWRRVAGLVVGFAGALLVLRPGSEVISPGAMMALGASLLWGGTVLTVRVLARTESTLTINAWLAIVLVPLTLIAALPVWRWPSLPEFGWLMAIAALATVAQSALSEAMRAADVAVVMPVDFTRLIWAALFGALAFGERPDLWVWIGGTVIFAAALWSQFSEGPDRSRRPATGGRP